MFNKKISCFMLQVGVFFLMMVFKRSFGYLGVMNGYI